MLYGVYQESFKYRFVFDLNKARIQFASDGLWRRHDSEEALIGIYIRCFSYPFSTWGARIFL